MIHVVPVYSIHPKWDTPKNHLNGEIRHLVSQTVIVITVHIWAEVKSRSRFGRFSHPRLTASRVLLLLGRRILLWFLFLFVSRRRRLLLASVAVLPPKQVASIANWDKRGPWCYNYIYLVYPLILSKMKGYKYKTERQWVCRILSGGLGTKYLK